MLLIAKHQIIDGLKDAKFLFLALIVLIAFVFNAFIYSDQYALQLEDWNDSVSATNQILEIMSANLQAVANQPQMMLKPPSALAFISDNGEQLFPNALTVNAFINRDVRLSTRDNEMIPVLPALDWSFIIGTLMTLMAILLGYSAICGDKQSGTLRQVLSNPLSRFKLFFGKYLGLATILLLTLLIGTGTNLVIMISLGNLPLGLDIAPIVGWALVISFLCLSFTLLLGLAVSSMTSRPAISLVVLLVIWSLAVFAIPGLARLTAEQFYQVRSNFELQQTLEAAADAIRDSHPDEAGNYYGDPHHEHVGLRCLMVKDLRAEELVIRDEFMSEKVNQARAARLFSWVSPSGLLSSAMEELSGTGVVGFMDLLEAARRYRMQLHSFTVEKDKTDPDSPHRVYSWGISSENGVFSAKPVEFSTVPRWWSLWPKIGLPSRQSLPLWQMVIFLVLNMQMAMLAFIALARYDPR